MDSNTPNSERSKELTAIDKMEHEQNLRQIISELKLKKIQVEQLHKDLDAANLKIHTLKRNLESASSEQSNAKYTNNLMTGRIKALEDKLHDRRDPIIKSRLQQEVLICENKTLKDMLETAEIEKSKLERTVEDLKFQNEIHVRNQKELMEQDSKIRITIAKSKEVTERLEKDLEPLSEMSLKINRCEDLQKTLVEFYKKQRNEMSEEKKIAEGKYIVTQASLEKLQELVRSFPLPQRESSMFFEEYDKEIENLRDQVQMQDEFSEALRKNLKEEMEANVQLCERSSAIDLEMEELKRKILEFNKSVVDTSTQTDGGVDNGKKSEEKIEIKDEPDVQIIEIDK